LSNLIYVKGCLSFLAFFPCIQSSPPWDARKENGDGGIGEAFFVHWNILDHSSIIRCAQGIYVFKVGLF